MNPLKWLWKQVFDDDESPPAPSQLVVVGLPSGEALAGLWQSTLEAAKIHCLVRNVNSLAVYGLPQFEILVQYKDLDTARELLDLDDAAREASS